MGVPFYLDAILPSFVTNYTKEKWMAVSAFRSRVCVCLGARGDDHDYSALYTMKHFMKGATEYVSNYSGNDCKDGKSN